MDFIVISLLRKLTQSFLTSRQLLYLFCYALYNSESGNIVSMNIVIVYTIEIRIQVCLMYIIEQIISMHIYEIYVIRLLNTFSFIVNITNSLENIHDLPLFIERYNNTINYP